MNNTELKENRDDWSKRIEYLEKLMLDLQSSQIDIEKNERVNTLVKYLMSSRDLLEENTKLVKNKMDTTINTLNGIIKQLTDKV